MLGAYLYTATGCKAVGGEEGEFKKIVRGGQPAGLPLTATANGGQRGL